MTSDIHNREYGEDNADLISDIRGPGPGPVLFAGDVPVTYADSEALERDYGFTPKIGIREGLRRFAEWYKEYYRVGP